ncbi:MAG: serine/threonine-protein kinase [Isosphaeraceae bacterium]
MMFAKPERKRPAPEGMNATIAPSPSNSNLQETIPYVPADAPERGRGGSAEPSHMPATSPESRNRYTFGSGARPLEGYTIKRAIGRGGFGEVYYATSDAGKEVALKLILRNLEVERRGVMQCMNLKSQNLITIHDLRTNDDGDTFVIMEYVAGPSLANILAQNPAGLPEHEVRAWLKGLVEGVAYLHDHGIVHRDLKPANLVLEEGIVKIGDYGLSKALTGSQQPGHSESVGTCHYMAPEISTGKYTKAIDIYAIGIILYELVTGRVPFDGESVGEVLMKHLTSRPDLSPLPEPYRTLVGKALAKDPNHRPKNAYELLPANDVPRAAEVRFVGDAGPKGQDDVLHIQDDSVFYIGPNTWPTRQQPPTWRDRLAGRRPAPPRQPAPVQPVAHRPMPQPRPQPQPRRPQPAPVAVPVRQVPAQAQAPRQPFVPPVPPAPPAPAPLPDGRFRVAELATSMLAAAPLAAASTAVAAYTDALGTSNFDQLAGLFGVILMAAWMVMGLNKLGEGRKLNPATRRLAGFGVGAITGLALLGLNQWAYLDLVPAQQFARPRPELASYIGPIADQPWAGVLELIGYFGLTFGLVGWWKQAARDRSSRLRFWPMATTAAIALVAAAAWPDPAAANWGPPVLIGTAAIVQLASPRDRAAAAYARWARKYKQAPAPANAAAAVA